MVCFFERSVCRVIIEVGIFVIGVNHLVSFFNCLFDQRRVSSPKMYDGSFCKRCSGGCILKIGVIVYFNSGNFIPAHHVLFFAFQVMGNGICEPYLEIGRCFYILFFHEITYLCRFFPLVVFDFVSSDVNCFRGEKVTYFV